MSPVGPAADNLSTSIRGPVLAIDYGRRRIGLALSDALGFAARPLAVWMRINRRRDLARLRDLCRLHAVSRIVVGCPLHLDGTPGEMAGEARRFAVRLSKDLALPVDLADERLSSWEAEQLLGEGRAAGRASRRRAKSFDDVAAAVILRDYLSRAPAARKG